MHLLTQAGSHALPGTVMLQRPVPASCLAGLGLLSQYLGAVSPCLCLQASLERLQEFAPATAATLRNICAPGQMQDSDFTALLASEGCPDSTTRREYAGRQVWHHLVGAVRWQFAAFAEVSRLRACAQSWLRCKACRTCWVNA